MLHHEIQRPYGKPENNGGDPVTRGEAAQAINELYGRGFGALRRLANFGSLSKLSKATGLSPATLSEIERGARPLKAHEIEWFCAFFAEKIPGYSEDQCLEILRQGARNHLRAVADSNDSLRGRDSNPQPSGYGASVLLTQKIAA